MFSGKYVVGTHRYWHMCLWSVLYTNDHVVYVFNAILCDKCIDILCELLSGLIVFYLRIKLLIKIGIYSSYVIHGLVLQITDGFDRLICSMKHYTYSYFIHIMKLADRNGSPYDTIQRGLS